MIGAVPESGSERAAVDAVAARLEDAILSGEIGPGERLSEQLLSARFGVSRGPLREAVRTLEGRRLLERTPFAGVRVVDPTLADLEHLLAVRESLEGTACRLAAENMSLLETRRLRACFSSYDRQIETEGLGSVFRRGSPDNDFHVQIVRGSRNPWLHTLLCRDLYAILRVVRLRSVGLGSRAEQATEEHLAILHAIENRDPDAAEQAMRLHIRRGRDNLLQQHAARAEGRVAHDVP